MKEGAKICVLFLCEMSNAPIQDKKEEVFNIQIIHLLTHFKLLWIEIILEHFQEQSSSLTWSFRMSLCPENAIKNHKTFHESRNFSVVRPNCLIEFYDLTLKRHPLSFAPLLQPDCRPCFNYFRFRHISDSESTQVWTPYTY